MRYLNFQNTALISFLVAGIAACSSGTDTPANTGAAATTSGAGGSGSTSAGTGGSSSTTSGTPSTTAASTTAATTTAGTGGAGGAAGTTGTGGSGGSAPGGPSVCDGKGSRILTIADGKVDNFEGAVISPGWSSFSDVMPTPNSFRIAQETGGALGTGHFGHYAGTGARTTLLGGYGVGTIYNLAIDVTAGIYCVDITAFDGMTFWARAATAAARVGVNFVTPETNLKATDPLIGGGDCVNPGCYNHPQKLVTLTTTWAQYNVTFAEAVGGTGARVKTVLQLVGFLSPDAAWDFSIDEIQLYKGTAPTGPVGGGDAGP